MDQPNQTQRSSVNPSVMRKVQLAQQAYKPIEQQRADPNGYILKHATDTVQMYQHGNTHVYVFRGTKLSDPRDIEADAAIPFGLLSHTRRYKQDKATVEKWLRDSRANQMNIEVTGHSLGGKLAREFYRAGIFPPGTKVDVFNAPKTIRDIAETSLGYTPQNVRVHGMSGDPFAQLGGDTDLYNLHGQTPLEAHSLSSFKALEPPVEGSGKRKKKRRC